VCISACDKDDVSIGHLSTNTLANISSFVYVNIHCYFVSIVQLLFALACSDSISHPVSSHVHRPCAECAKIDACHLRGIRHPVTLECLNLLDLQSSAPGCPTVNDLWFAHDFPSRGVLLGIYYPDGTEMLMLRSGYVQVSCIVRFKL
jgi:hypothetical protein